MRVTFVEVWVASLKFSCEKGRDCAYNYWLPQTLLTTRQFGWCISGFLTPNEKFLTFQVSKPKQGLGSHPFQSSFRRFPGAHAQVFICKRLLISNSSKYLNDCTATEKQNVYRMGARTNTSWTCSPSYTVRNFVWWKIRSAHIIRGKCATSISQVIMAGYNRNSRLQENLFI